MSVVSLAGAARGQATAVWLRPRSGSPPRKNGASAQALTTTATADPHPRNREQSCGQRGAGCVRGESVPSPIGSLPSRFTPCRVSRREQSLRLSHIADAELTGRARGRRPVRGVRAKTVNRVWRRGDRSRHGFATGARVSWLPKRFLAGLRMTPGEGVIVSTGAGRPDFPRRRTGRRSRLAR